MTRPTGQPYRFLDDYRFTEADIAVFHGRKREAALLVSELTTRRLVVLFAPTGTGKSSLINAGVRPLLEGLGYKTVLVRVERDPDRSLRAALSAENLLRERGQPASLGQCVCAAIAEAGRPIVIFLDQFEEFFLYVHREDPARARAFISDIAELYRDRNVGAHFAFSMREDFFIEMDVFRDAIPTIFQQNSGLRLRALQRDQAREAIREPALSLKVTFDEELVSDKPAAGKPELLLDDLAAIGSAGLISPVHLQVVCDTLWRRRLDGSRITAALYQEIGPVVRILDDRFRTDIADTLTDFELVLFARLLPLLRSDEGRGTKSLVSIDLLTEKLQTDSATVQALIDKLENLRFLNRGVAGTVNWASDYLSGRLEHLLYAARSIYLRRLLAGAMRRSAAIQPVPRDASLPETAADVEARFMSHADFEEISNGRRYLAGSPAKPGDPPGDSPLDLSSGEIRFLFEASLEHGCDVDEWCAHAAKAGIDVIAELKARILDPAFRTEQAANAVRAIIRIASPEAMHVVREAIAGTVWSPLIVTELGMSPNPAALAILRHWLAVNPPAPAVAQYLALNWSPEARSLLAAFHRSERGLASSSRPTGTRSLDPSHESMQWELLVRTIRDGKLIPVIGQGSLSARALEILRERDPNSPVRRDMDFFGQVDFIREEVLDVLQAAARDDPSSSALALSTWARLPLPYYLTTRYDDALSDLLRQAAKEPQTQFPDWNANGSSSPRVEPGITAPLVYHLHGHASVPNSVVLSLQDKFSLLGEIAANPAALSLDVQGRLANSTVVFFDFDPSSSEFQSVLTIYGRIRAWRRQAICVPTVSDSLDDATRRLYEYALTRWNIRTYWGSPAEFTDTLLHHREAAHGS